MGEKLVRVRNDFLVNYEMTPTQQHQVYEELLQLEKEYASVIYFQKDLDRGNY